MSFANWFFTSWSLIFPVVYTYKKMTYYVNQNVEPTPPPQPVSIVIPAFNEEFFIGATLESLKNQNVVSAYPEMFQIIVVDNESTDNTAQVAKQYTSHVISSERGKLNARHAGIMYASNPIIVCCDADCKYGVNHLNLMLQHYYREDVVAVYGPFVNVHEAPMVSASGWCGLLGYLKPPFGRFFGSNSSFTKEAYTDCGGLDLDIDQFRRAVINREEEVLFYHRLRTQGRVIYDARLGVFHTGRYEFCLASGFFKRCSLVNGYADPICQYCACVLRGERFK